MIGVSKIQITIKNYKVMTKNRAQSRQIYFIEVVGLQVTTLLIACRVFFKDFSLFLGMLVLHDITNGCLRILLAYFIFQHFLQRLVF